MTPETLVIATGNLHKFREIAQFLEGTPWRLAGLAEFPSFPMPEETGETFEANAVFKAKYCCRHLDLPCVADDSGLAVDALDGAPGVRSARYAGAPGADAENNAKLLRALEGVPEPARTARFICCCALVEPGARVHVEHGIVEGRVAGSCRGGRGFGYDPLFVPNGYSQTFGELEPSIKAAISHRALAFGRLRAYLESRA